MEGFYAAPRIAWGAGALEPLSGFGATRALVVVDPDVTRQHLDRRVLEELAKGETSVETCSDVVREPTVASIDPIADRIRAFHPDWIVAVGGGSTLDTAKAAWARAAAPELAPGGVTPLADLRPRSVARLVAVPTNSGSGSDATWSAHLWADDGRLVEVVHPELLPDWSLLDPSLPLRAPREVAADGIADTLAHAFEALFSQWANPFADAAARAALTTLFEVLPKLGKEGDDDERRARLHYAATLAGIASANASLGIAHALAHAVGGSVRRPHGRLVAAFLPFALEFNYPVARDRVHALAPIVGGPAAQNRSGLTERLRALWGPLGLPITLAEAGVDRAAIDRDRAAIVARAGASPALLSNPRVASAVELGRLLDAALDRRPVDF